MVRVGGVGRERRDEARGWVTRAGRVGEGEARRADLAVSRIAGAVRPAAVRRQRHVEVDVLVDGVVPVRVVDDVVAAVAAERRDHDARTRVEQRGAVVLEAAPDRVPARDWAGVRVVILERVEPVVQRGEARRAGVHVPAVNAAVVADVHLPVPERDRVLVGMRGRRAVVDACRGAGQPEVPVRAGRLPGRAAAEALEHFLESEEDVIRVRRIDGEELVVPGLDAGVVPL